MASPCGTKTLVVSITFFIPRVVIFDRNPVEVNDFLWGSIYWTVFQLPKTPSQLDSKANSSMMGFQPLHTDELQRKKSIRILEGSSWADASTVERHLGSPLLGAASRRHRRTAPETCRYFGPPHWTPRRRQRRRGAKATWRSTHTRTDSNLIFFSVASSSPSTRTCCFVFRSLIFAHFLPRFTEFQLWFLSTSEPVKPFYYFFYLLEYLPP